MRSPAVICEQWERNLSFSSADVREAGTRNEPLRTSAWEATNYKARNRYSEMVMARTVQNAGLGLSKIKT